MTSLAGANPRSTPGWRSVVAALIVVVLLLVGGIVLGRVTSPTPPPFPTTRSAEAGFARDMQTHHEQAVEMSMIIRQKTDDPGILTLSYDIATSQAQQAGQMFGWLNVWGVPQASPEPEMTWMTRPALEGSSHEHGSGMESHVPGERMPGLATPEQIDALEAATGEDADEMFLELMIAHHQGGVEMAKALLDRSENDVVTSLARGVVTSQQGEIDYMNELLA